MTRRTMTFAVAGCFGGVNLQSNAERFALIEEAEALGFHAFWLNEEHFQESNRLCTSPLVVGAALAARTRRLRIGTAVMLLPLHHPLQLAEEIATLDVISDGRVDVGVSRGGVQRYYDGFGIDRSERFDRFEEALELMLRAWSHERFSFEGRYYRVPEVPLRPRPLQRPHPPVFIASYDIPSCQQFARQGFGILEGGIQHPRAIAAKTDAYVRAWRTAWPDRPVPPIPTNRMLYCGADDASAMAEIEPYLERAFKGQKRASAVQGGGTLFSEDAPWQEFRDEVAIVGGPETVRRRLEALHDECGVTYVNALVHFFWEMPAELMRASMARLAKHVMPHFAPPA